MRIRVATLQYFIRPITSFEQFAEQVSALVASAADYECQLLVFPEDFTIQLLTLGDVRRPLRDQVLDLADHVERYVALLSGLAKAHKLYILGGTSPVRGTTPSSIHNRAFFFAPSGKYETQGKLHMTRFEHEDWQVSSDERLKIFNTSFGPVAVAICYDVEFPEIARAAARAGVHILLVPACTDDRQGFLRVRYCAHARAIENQIYVVVSHTVGSLPTVPAIMMNYGQAAILTPSDFPFSRDGILAEGTMNSEMMILGELNMETIVSSRVSGTVLPLHDSATTMSRLMDIEQVTL
jgi:predicted amidohydrolase